MLLLVSVTHDHGSQRVNMDDVVTAVGNSKTVVYALPFSPAGMGSSRSGLTGTARNRFGSDANKYSSDDRLHGRR